MASIYRRKGRKNYWVEYRDGDGITRRRSTGVSDKEAAEATAADWIKTAYLVRQGLVCKKEVTAADASEKPILEHVDAYITHCHREQAERHVLQKKRHLLAFVGERSLSWLRDLTQEALEENMTALVGEGKSARTANIRRAHAVAFAAWCVDKEFVTANPLGKVNRRDETRDQRRRRRALTTEEIARLLAVAEQRGRLLWYLTALLAGLRKSEMKALVWSDIDLGAGTLTVREGKAKGRIDVLPIHPNLAEEFRRVRPKMTRPSQHRVFPAVVTDRTRDKDFDRAGISKEDETGRVVDLHSLRGTLCTLLARQGVTPQIVQRLLRHADYRTTQKHYTHLEIADDARALSEIKLTPLCEADRRKSILAVDGGVGIGEGLARLNPPERASTCRNQGGEAETPKPREKPADGQETRDSRKGGVERVMGLEPTTFSLGELLHPLQNPLKKQGVTTTHDPMVRERVSGGVQEGADSGRFQDRGAGDPKPCRDFAGRCLLTRQLLTLKNLALRACLSPLPLTFANQDHSGSLEVGHSSSAETLPRGSRFRLPGGSASVC